MIIKKNDLVEIVIEDMNNEGAGVGKIDGYILFVKDTCIGDKALVKVVKAGKSYGFGRLEKLIKPSENRVSAVCPVARACGGCQLQEMTYASQLSFKENKVRNNLIRLGGFSEEKINKALKPIVGMDNPLGYRCKAQYPVGADKDGNIVIGFFAGRTHSIIPVEDCKIGCRENKEIVNIIKEHMNRLHILPYDEKTGKGLIRHILIRKGYNTGELAVCIVVNKPAAGSTKGDIIPGQMELAETLSGVTGMKSITVSFNNDRNNVILGKEVRTIWGSDRIRDTIVDKNNSREIIFEISPLSFYQVNPQMTEKMYEKAREYAAIKEKDVVWDLYCGIGTISLFMADGIGKIYGVEVVEAAIEDAKTNSRINKIENAEFLCGDAGQLAKTLPKANVIVVDPPRKGLEPELIDTIVTTSPERVVYVSCDSATLSRDLKLFCEKGYELIELTPFDNFPQTVHVETVVLIQRKDM